ncbi:MAG: virB8 family protein [Alphaproteobacteria bacterium]|jgi:type IV secretion system protein VirB8|nr:type IV secretion system protein [Candidatus Jidaibacter sp.]
MGLFDKMSAKDKQSSDMKSQERFSKNWFQDRSDWLLVQRNILFGLLLIAIATVFSLTFFISYIKGVKSIEPFVIEIEPKTGVPTVVEPLSAVVYSSDEAVKKYFVWKYIKLRQEYYYSTYQQAYEEVGLLSAQDVYGQFRRDNNQNNVQSPFYLLGSNSHRDVELKSMIFQDRSTVQVRVRELTSGAQNSTADKIIFMKFEFNNLEMSDKKRLVNPLGFTVTLYRVDNERL